MTLANFIALGVLLACSVSASVPSGQGDIEVVVSDNDFPTLAHNSLTRIFSDNQDVNIPEVVERMNVLRQNVITEGTCNPNICFALDGGASVTDSEYRALQDFVNVVSAFLNAGNSGVTFAAVQFGRRSRVISRRTNVIDDFLIDVDNSIRRGGRPSSVELGLQFCISELEGKDEDANKIVLLMNKFSQISESTVQLARNSRKPSGDISICAVGVGLSNQSFLDQITGDPERSLMVDDFFELLDIFEKVIQEVCDTT